MPRSSKRRPPKGVWLDHLPLEVCIRISAILPPWQLCKEHSETGDIELHPPALRLAAVSDHLTRAVATERSHVIRIEHTVCGAHLGRLLETWYNLFTRSVREIHLPDGLLLGHGHDQFLARRHVFSLPSIAKASVPNEPQLLTALARGGAVKHLQVDFMPSTQRSEHLPLLHVLRSCPVEKLRLVCGACILDPHEPCVAAKLLESLKGKASRLSLKSLEVVCYSRKLQRLCESMSAFPNLQSVSLQHWVHEEGCCNHAPESDRHFQLAMSKKMKAHFRRIKSVALINCGKVDDFAHIFKDRLTSITSQEVVSAKMLKSLENCPNLESLGIALGEDAVHQFPTNICSLRSLSLSFPCDVASALENDVFPTPDFILPLIRRNRELQDLALGHMEIPAEMLEEILKAVGERLRRVHLPLHDSPECPKTRLVRIIRLLMKYNHNVTYIDLMLGARDYSTGCTLHDYDECYSDARNDCRSCNSWRRAEMVISVVTRRLPMLKPRNVDQLRWIFGMYNRMEPSCPLM